MSRRRPVEVAAFVPPAKAHLILDAKGVTGLADCLHGFNDVAIHEALVVVALLFAKANSVQDLHLLEDGGLATLSRAKKEELDLSQDVQRFRKCEEIHFERQIHSCQQVECAGALLER
eukprot:scaffold926_cov248-Pinguiococcus_pyrenoidosus.AAC.9